MSLTHFEQRLLNEFQHHFPLESRPFRKLGSVLESEEKFVIRQVKSLSKRGFISRIGPVFRPNSVGASTLAAMSVPTSALEDIAAVVSSFDAVNHNYEREHRFNLWFVVTEPDQLSLRKTLAEIELKTGYDVMSLPMLRAFHIDLGFDLGFDETRRLDQKSSHSRDIDGSLQSKVELSVLDEQVIAAIQSGLPLCERPYEELATRMDIQADVLTSTITRLCDVGVIKRWGLVVRHHELGYRANAMVVWNVPDSKLDQVAAKLAKTDGVTLCYQRPRKLPLWPYNLFCMIHGKSQQQVRGKIGSMVRELELSDIPNDVLFSLRRFKQCGARYRVSAKSNNTAAGVLHG